MSMSLWSLLHSLSLSLSAFNIFSLKEEKKTETVKEATHLSLSLSLSAFLFLSLLKESKHFDCGWFSTDQGRRVPG